jgi:hypothetical protein
LSREPLGVAVARGVDGDQVVGVERELGRSGASDAGVRHETATLGAGVAGSPQMRQQPSRSRGGHLDLDNWRRREWVPAVDAAGLDRRRIYDLRHTGISEWLAAGLSVFEVSRYAGTSLQMTSTVYGHLTFGALDTAASRLDAHAAGVWPTSGPLAENTAD